MDAYVAYLAQDDFMSRVSSTVYNRFGTFGGTKVVRGWSDSSKAAADAKAAESEDKQSPAKTDVEHAE
ncbi:MAG: hypothetical protein M1823_008602, partial [Watsoniomyces obsoletus]